MPDGIDREKLINAARQHLSAETDLADDVARINTDLLVCHLREQAREYKENILPLHPDNPALRFGHPDEIDDSFETYDSEKNEFLESLWDVIYQHFTDNGDV